MPAMPSHVMTSTTGTSQRSQNGTFCEFMSPSSPGMLQGALFHHRLSL